MCGVEVVSKVREGNGGRSKLQALDVQLVVSVLEVVRRVEMCVIDVCLAIQGGNGRLQKKKSVRLTLTAPPFQTEGGYQFGQSALCKSASC